MSDLYVHLFPFGGRWDHRNDNLVVLGRYLVLNASQIDARGGLAFGHEDMSGLRPPPEVIVADTAAMLPPLAYGPHAGITPEPGEDWPAYCQRVFGIHEHRPFMVWLQSAMWKKTDPSPIGAGLRIAYALDYGVPHDYVEIAMGQAHTDYDRNGFLWEKLDLLPDPDFKPKRDWPQWIGAVELNRRRSEINADFMIPPEEPFCSAGCGAAGLAPLKAKLGTMPDIYSDFLLLSGRRVRRNRAGAYADQLEETNRLARERIFAKGTDRDDPVPQDAIFIDARDGGDFAFILGGNRQDSPVFRFDAATGKVTQASMSIWTWIEGFMREVEHEPTRNMTPPVVAPSGNPYKDGKAAYLVSYMLLAGGVVLTGWLAYTVISFFG